MQEPALGLGRLRQGHRAVSGVWYGDQIEPTGERDDRMPRVRLVTAVERIREVNPA